MDGVGTGEGILATLKYALPYAFVMFATLWFLVHSILYIVKGEAIPAIAFFSMAFFEGCLALWWSIKIMPEVVAYWLAKG